MRRQGLHVEFWMGNLSQDVHLEEREGDG